MDWLTFALLATLPALIIIARAPSHRARNAPRIIKRADFRNRKDI